MDFCRVILLNICMFGNENSRIDFNNEILSYCKFILNNCKEEKFDIHFSMLIVGMTNVQN